jgi:hypothetical protein
MGPLAVFAKAALLSSGISFHGAGQETRALQQLRWRLIAARDAKPGCITTRPRRHSIVEVPTQPEKTSAERFVIRTKVRVWPGCGEANLLQVMERTSHHEGAAPP